MGLYPSTAIIEPPHFVGDRDVPCLADISSRTTTLLRVAVAIGTGFCLPSMVEVM